MSVSRTGSSARHASRGFEPGAPDRLWLFFLVRYSTPALVLVALAASPDVPVPRGRLVALLLAQAAFGLATQSFAIRVPRLLSPAVWGCVLGDIAVVGGLAASTGGADSPLLFLFALEVIAAGILLSSTVGLRLLVAATLAILALDLAGSAGVTDAPGFPRGLQAIAALWVVAGSAILFSVSNERELRRRNAELATIRRVTLDIEDTLSLEEILADLCRGVVDAFGFGGAAVLLRDADGFVCRGAYGATGRIGAAVPDRGPIRDAVTAGTPAIVSTEEARRDGALTEVFGGRGYVIVPLGPVGALVATRAGRRGRPGTVRQREVEALTSLAHHAVLALANARLHAEMSEMAIRDPLTGLANHGEFQRVLAHEVGRIERFSSLQAPKHRLSLLMIDIDKFKAFNDRHGHQAGDAVIAGVARAISSAVRSFDTAARYGGEEFAVVLPETDSEAACQVAERVRQTVQTTVFAPGARVRPRPVTVSIGVSTHSGDQTSPAELIARADEALYRSKQDGRDRVSLAGTGARRPRRVVAALTSSGEAGSKKAGVTRPRTGSSARRAGGGSKLARGRSSRPTRRTPHGR